MEPDILAPESSPPRPRPPPLSPSGFTVPATPPHGNYMMDVEKVAHGPPQGAGAAPIPGPTSSALLPLPEGGYLQHEEGGWAMWSEMVEAPQSPPRYRMTSSSNLGSPMRGVEPTTAPQPGLSTFRRLFVGGDEDVPMAEAGGAVSAHSEASSAGPNPQEGEMDAAGAVARLQRTHALDDALAGADAVSAGPGQRRRGPRGSRSPQNAPLPEAERDAFLASLDKDRDDYLEPTMLGDVDYEEEEADDDVQDREDVDSETPEQAREALRAIGIMREKPSTLDKIIREHCNPDEAPKERLPTKARERELAAMIAEHNLDSRFPETIDLLETMAKERKQVVPPGGKEKAGSPYLAIGAIVSQTTGILEFTIFVPGCDYSANYKVVKKSILFLTTETMRTMALKLFTPGDGGLYKNASFQLLDTHLTFFVRLLKYRGMDRCKVTLADESDLFWVPGWFASRNHRGLGRVSNICICALLKYSLNLIADDVREHTMQGWPQEEIHEHPEGFLSVPSVPIQKKDRPIIVSYGGSDSKLNGRVRTKGIVSNEEIKLQLGRALAAGHSLMRVQPRPVGPLHEKLEKFRNLMQKYLNVASEFKSFSQLPTEAEWRPFFEADFKAKGDTMLDLILTDPISAKHVRDEGQVIVTDEYKPLIGPIRKGALSLSGPTASPHFRVRGHPGQAAIANRAFEGKSVIMTMDVVAQLDAACNGAINDAFFMPMMDELGKVRRDAEGKIIYASFLTKYVTFRQGSAEPEWSVLGLDGAPKEFLEAWRSPHPLGSRMRKSDRMCEPPGDLAIFAGSFPQHPKDLQFNREEFMMLVSKMSHIQLASKLAAKQSRDRIASNRVFVVEMGEVPKGVARPLHAERMTRPFRLLDVVTQGYGQVPDDAIPKYATHAQSDDRWVQRLGHGHLHVFQKIGRSSTAEGTNAIVLTVLGCPIVNISYDTKLQAHNDLFFRLNDQSRALSGQQVNAALSSTRDLGLLKVQTGDFFSGFSSNGFHDLMLNCLGFPPPGERRGWKEEARSVRSLGTEVENALGLKVLDIGDSILWCPRIRVTYSVLDVHKKVTDADTIGTRYAQQRTKKSIYKTGAATENDEDSSGGE